MARRFDRKGYQRDMGSCKGIRKYPNGRIGKCNHPSHGCFAGETNVYTPDGPRAIQTLRVGDNVQAFDIATNELASRRILRKVERQPMPVLAVKLAGADAPLVVTASHSMLSRHRGWRRVSELCAGDLLVVPTGADLEIIDISAAGSCPVFNLIVERDSTFLVGAGVAAHSFTTLRSLRAGLEKVLSLFRHGAHETALVQYRCKCEDHYMRTRQKGLYAKVLRPPTRHWDRAACEAYRRQLPLH